MVEAKLITMINVQCEGIDNDGRAALDAPHCVPLKAYDDGSTMPVGCKYMQDNGSGDHLCDPELNGYEAILENLAKCKLCTRN